jgi:cell division protein FtsB
MASIRRRFKQCVSLNDRLRTFADQLKAKAEELRPGPERDALLKRARRADTASHIDEWADSPGLQPPK